MNKRAKITLVVMVFSLASAVSLYAYTHIKKRHDGKVIPLLEAPLKIHTIFRQLDDAYDKNLDIYLEISYGSYQHRIPETGYLTFFPLQKILLGYEKEIRKEELTEAGLITIYDSTDAVIGKLGFIFDADRFGYFPLSNCELFPYYLEHIYPYKQFPTYIPRHSRRFACNGSDNRRIEIILIQSHSQ